MLFRSAGPAIQVGPPSWAPYCEPGHGHSRAAQEGGPLRYQRSSGPQHARLRSIQLIRGVIHTVPHQQREILTAEGMLAVVRFLVPDIIAEIGIVERGYAECTVAMLPSEVAPMREGIVNPLRCSGLDSIYQVRESESTGRLKIQMDVIPGTSSAEKLSTSLLDYGGRAREQPGAPLRIEPRPAILGSPHEMNPKREIGIHSTICRNDAAGISFRG